MNDMDEIFNNLSESEKNLAEGIGHFVYGKKTWNELTYNQKKEILQELDLIPAQ